MLFYINWSRFSLQEVDFIALYYVRKQPAEKVMKKLRIHKSRFYDLRKRVQGFIESDYRRAKTSNPKLKPLDYAWEENVVKITLPSGDDSLPHLQTRYIDTFGKIPNRYKNDKDWLSTKLSCFSGVRETKVD